MIIVLLVVMIVVQFQSLSLSSSLLLSVVSLTFLNFSCSALFNALRRVIFGAIMIMMDDVDHDEIMMMMVPGFSIVAAFDFLSFTFLISVELNNNPVDDDDDDG